MSFSIAIAGKGGVGKTLVCGMLARRMADVGAGPVLVVDADANANVNEVLGMPAGESVGAIREEMKCASGATSDGMTRAEFLEYKIERALSEGDGLDLLVMGRPEGPGCYCYANNLLRDILRRLADRYRYVVIDNEAGMEHLSRRLMQDLDLLLIISDPTLRGIDTAFRLSRVPEEVETRVGAKALLVNRVPQGGLSAEAERRIEDGGLRFLGSIPEDPEVTRCDQELGSLSSLYPDSVFARHVADIATRLGLDPFPHHLRTAAAGSDVPSRPSPSGRIDARSSTPSASASPRAATTRSSRPPRDTSR